MSIASSDFSGEAILVWGVLRYDGAAGPPGTFASHVRRLVRLSGGGFSEPERAVQ
ncbi:hypothetical protein [Actinotignum schaalii]|uniref:hypothetical protein n=1 Tax=Actinotignum schaalii TaxID=59505 RepID=UPI00040899DF|nr:hypothetical protein [Actinotignum schaalii]WQN44469.1 hypothetical protein U4A90_05575 [Actinotignum schaalii]